MRSYLRRQDEDEELREDWLRQSGEINATVSFNHHSLCSNTTLTQCLTFTVIQPHLFQNF